MDIVEIYGKAAEEYFKKNETSAQFVSLHFLPEEQKQHIIDITRSIMMTRDSVGYPGGGFVKAVVNNDLAGAIGRGDSTCLKALPFLVTASLYCHPKTS